MESYEFLVSMLSVVLIVLLVIILVAVIYFIRILKRINEISVKASNVMNSVEVAGKVFEKSAAPVAISRIVANIVESVQSKKKGKK
jgi:sensor histidine kinase YesM